MSIYVYSWNIDKLETDSTLIRAYGLDEQNRNVCLHIVGFHPHIYIELPTEKIKWTEQMAQSICDKIRSMFGKDKQPIRNSFVEKKKLYYAQKSTFPYIFMTFNSTSHINYVSKVIQSEKFWVGHTEVKLKIHEKRVSPILQIISRQNIPSAGWINFPTKNKLKGDDKQTSCYSEYVVNWKDLKPSTLTKIACPTIMSFDFEVNSHDPTTMPCCTRSGDEIFQGSYIINKFNDSKVIKILATMGDPIQSKVGDDVEIIKCKQEHEIIESYLHVIKKYKPNIVVGYNIFGFDIPYMIERAKSCYCDDYYTQQGFLLNRRCEDVDIKWSSSAVKNQIYRYTNAEGILFIDMMIIIRRDYKFDNYKLKTVSTFFLGETKDPLTEKDIFKAYRMGAKCNENGEFPMRGRQLISECGKYCVQDSLLVSKLMDKLQLWIGLSEMAKTCNTSIFALYTQGQQIRIYSQIYKKCMYSGYVVEDDVYKTKDDEHYLGATVLTPIPGMYEDVIPFDFQSLYPSSIIAENIDYTTLVIDDNIPDSKCNVIEWDEHYGCKCTFDVSTVKNPKFKMCGHRKFRFLKEPKGIMPSLLEDLLNMRKATRKEMKVVEEKIRLLEESGVKNSELDELKLYLIVLDKRQLAYKIISNSGYGSMGVREGYLPFMPGAMCTTAIGRRSIDIVSKYIPEKFGGKIVYGDTDSNYVHFPHLHDKSVAEKWEFAIHVAEETSKLFKSPMKLDFESKIYTKFLILNKKRYMCLSCGKDGVVSDKIDKKGVLLARRDNSKIVKDIYSSVIMSMFNKEDEDFVIYNLLNSINMLCARAMSYKKFIITKSVGNTNDMQITDVKTTVRRYGKNVKEITTGLMGDYKINILPSDEVERSRLMKLKNAYTEKEYYLHSLPAQVQLSEKMKRRGMIVNVGTRIEYLIVTTNGTYVHNDKEKQYEKLENADYYVNNIDYIKIDVLSYLKLLANPVDEVLGVIYHLDNFILKQYKYRIQRMYMLEELKKLFRGRLLFFMD